MYVIAAVDLLVVSPTSSLSFHCSCSEHNFPNVTAHMYGDVNAVVRYDYDGIKLDGCGEFLNLTWWADLLNATGRPILIENCHWGAVLTGNCIEPVCSLCHFLSPHRPDGAHAGLVPLELLPHQRRCQWL